ncbi:zinc ribbon domain-containing protein [Xanthomonas nasturtii]|uniref:zinc ribbon domain-containing protein n=1 Tax=Xanthomonas nasturtii TaxID=1843581 RepID=UPI001290382E|nr:zinc ribbon domain-containing protein [Xanthomonas nasturtii]
MAMTKCRACSSQISRKAAFCPKCGHPNKEANYLSGAQVFGGFLFAGLAIWWFAGGGFDSQVTSDIEKIEDRVVADSLNQYNIAKRQGDPTQICVQAGLVSAAYLQSKDEKNYRIAKKIEAQECQRAGVPE